MTEGDPQGNDEETSSIRNENACLIESMSHKPNSKKSLLSQTVIVIVARPRVVPLPVIWGHRSSALSAS